MLEMLDIGIDQCVAYRLEGKISDDEMHRILSSMKEKIDRYGTVSIYQEIVSIGGVEFDAMKTKLAFFLENGFSGIRKVAVLSQKQWVRKLIDLEGKCFKQMDMKGFPFEDREDAIRFLKQ